MDYLIGGLIVWGMVSLPVGLLLGRMFNRMEYGQHEYGQHEYGQHEQQLPSPMFTYVGPMPVMPMEQYDDYDDEDEPSKERMN